MSQLPEFGEPNEHVREIYEKTEILRKPITGIVSGYHELPYILIAPDEQDKNRSIEINGKINVSPKFIISSAMLRESFGDVFDPDTFSEDIQGRLFSFGYARKRNVTIESEYLTIKHIDSRVRAHCDVVMDRMLAQENIATGVIYGPQFEFYPVSIDRFISEIIDREFRF
jgi:hypothetical protein